jgi:hypothetical protein
MLFLEQVKLRDILPMYRVGIQSLVLCIDHCIADGLSLASLLALVATDGNERGNPLHLTDYLFLK